MDEKQKIKNQQVSIYNRAKIEMTGVLEIVSSTDREVYVKLDDSLALIVGEGLTITKLIPENELISVSGKINGLSYVSKQNKKSILGKVFK